MSFHLYNRHAQAHVGKRFPGATVLDLTSRGPDPWVRFSPFYPHGGIPVPFTPGRTAASVVGVDANPEAYEHARLKYTSETVRFERTMIELWRGDADCVVFLQTIEHVQDPGAVLENFKASAPVAFVSTPNVLTLAPEGEERSGNPWHIKEYRLEEFRELCEAHYATVEVYGLYHARKLALHERAIKRFAWDDVHKRLGITKRFYDWFVPAISVSDFVLRPADDGALDFLAVCRSR